VGFDHVEAAEPTRTLVALLDLAPHVPGAAADLPFVHARLAAERPPRRRHRTAAPAADGLAVGVAFGDSPLIGGDNARALGTHAVHIGAGVGIRQSPHGGSAAAVTIVLVARSRPRERHDALVMAAGFVTALVYPVWTGGDWMPLFRLHAPVAIFAVPLLAWGGAAIADEAGRWKDLATTALSVGVLLLALTTYRSELPLITRLHVLRTANDFFLRFGELAAGSSPDVTYAVADIGGFGWASDTRILDLTGLATGSLARRPHGIDGPDPTPELLARRPDVVLPLLYSGTDQGFRRELFTVALELSRGPVSRDRALSVMRYPRVRPDAETLAFLRSAPEYELRNIHVFPDLPQYYLVFVRRDALPRVPKPLLERRIGEGFVEYEAGDRARGLQLITDDFERKPYDELGLAEHATRLAAAGQRDKARGMLTRAIALNPRHAGYHSQLGDLYAVDKRMEEAVRELRLSVDLDSTSAAAYNNLGFYLGVLGRWDEAASALEEALNLMPDFQLARNNLAWVQSERARRRGDQ
jgi:tetratricopeptide (TPR) repeat protein